MTKDEALNHLKAITEAFGPDAGIELDQKAWSKLHTAIKEALAQPERLAELGWQEIDCPICGGGARAFPKPEQEPVAWYRDEDGIRIYYESKVWDDATPLYATPPQRTWVGLTKEEIADFDTWHDNREEEAGWCNPSEIVAYIEAKLRSKNHEH